MKPLYIFTFISFILIVLYSALPIPVGAPIDTVIATFDKPQKEEVTIHLNFVGDILAARAVETTMRKKGYDYPFEKIGGALADADITFANLETPLIGTATSGRTTPGGTTVFRGDIDFANALKKTGIDVVSLANNHMKDQGQKGLLSTINVLNEAGIAHAGAGATLTDARRLTIIETKGIKVGYLAYNDADVVPEPYHATDKQSGTNIMNIERLKEDIELARPRVDILIISMHSGTEYVTTHANKRQIDFAHTAIDAGADMVIGHHPHVLQPAQLYKGKYIFYSLGNFVFDQPWPDTKESVLLTMNIVLSREVKSEWKIDTNIPNITPLIIQNFQPQEATDSAKRKLIFDKIGELKPEQKNILTIGNQNIFIELATTTEARILGLSHRKKLPENTGLLFVFDTSNKHGIWMKDMLFPIDIYWFDKNLTLIDQALSVDPTTYPHVFYPKTDAVYVLETEAGVLKSVSLTKNLTGQLTLVERYDKR